MNAERVKAIGIGIPGIVMNDEKIAAIPQLPEFEGINLKKLFQEKYQLPVFIENDVKLMTVGYYSCRMKNLNNMVFLYIGNGIGGGTIINGQLYKGNTCFAGEFGYIPSGQEETEEEFPGGSLEKRLTSLKKEMKKPDQREKAKSQFCIEIGRALVSCAAMINPEAVVLYCKELDKEALQMISYEIKKFLPQHSIPQIYLTANNNYGILGLYICVRKELIQNAAVGYNRKIKCRDEVRQLGKEQMIWVSMDGGGTKTELCACNSQGEKIFSQFFGRANYKTAGIEEVSETLSTAVQNMLQSLECQMDDIAGMVLAIAGCDTYQDVKIYTEIMLAAGIPEEKILICNDTEVVFRALSDINGICVVAGTGSIACAYDNHGMCARIGGWGAPLSDMGSGYWIGAEILKRMIRWLDGMQEKESTVYQEIARQFSKPGVELSWILADLSVTEVASVSALFFHMRRKGMNFAGI